MRHLGSRIDSASTAVENGVTPRTKNLKPIVFAKIRSAASPNPSVEVEPLPFNYRASSALPPLSVCDDKDNKNYQEEDNDDAGTLDEPPNNHGLACDDDMIEEMLDAPLGMLQETGGEEKKNFDLMNITITIYGISGILCVEKELKKKPSAVTSIIPMVRRRSALKAAAKASSFEQQQAQKQNNIPTTTVAASVKRNAISSSSVIETFLPSKPLSIKSAPGKDTKLSALWQTPISKAQELEEGRDENVAPTRDAHASFEVLRMMMKRPYSREQSPGLVENYVHEHVQIGINLCRGKELMRVGVATLIITGEEEGHVMMHIPARPCGNPGVHERKSSSKSKSANGTKKQHTMKKSKKAKMHFENDKCHFRLDENSSLCLGVQVHPQQDVEAAERFEEIEQTDSQLLRNAHAAKVYMMEMREQDNIQQQQHQKHILVDRRSTETRLNNSKIASASASVSVKTMVVEQKPATTVPRPSSGLASVLPQNSILAGMFCGALPGMTTAAPTPTNKDNKSVVTKENSSAGGSGDSDDHDGSYSENAMDSHLPVDEVMNVKYHPAYAKSFFSAVTFAATDMYEDDDDYDDDYDDEEDLEHFSKIVEENARKLV